MNLWIIEARKNNKKIKNEKKVDNFNIQILFYLGEI